MSKWFGKTYNGVPKVKDWQQGKITNLRDIAKQEEKGRKKNDKRA